jgi:hypothetical protein
MSDDEAPGWDAIDQVLRQLYGTQEPKHIGYVPGLALGSGLQGCSAYDAGDHWHYVSYGLTELWSKDDGSDPDVSGWGYELTTRVVGSRPGEPPAWPFGLLEKIARHTQHNAHPFEVGDRLDPGGPLTSDEPTELTAVAFIRDPQLGGVTSLNGRFDFRQLVGVTARELAEMRSSTNDVVLDRLRVGNALLVTDPSRRS